MKTNKLKQPKLIFLTISITMVIFFLMVLTIATIIYNKYDLDETKLTEFNNGVVVLSSASSNNSLYNTNRAIIEIENLPEYVKDAFISTEDKRFYKHNGYDAKRIIKAAFVNMITKSKTQGASTISQQLIKNTLLTNEKTFARKLKELVLSLKMEKKYSKEDILEMYLNTIYFGSNAYGIDNASKTYFNKSASDLTLNEACCLAGIIKSPSYYSPLLNYDNAFKRKNLVAHNMFREGYISYEQLNEVLNSEINITANKNFDYSYEQEAIFEACELLNITERQLINKGYVIVSYKDDNLQKDTIRLNNLVIDSSEKQYGSPLDSLSIVINNQGHVLSYYANSNYNLHNLKRQPASTLKPLAVYLPCLSRNILTPATPILDEEINYSGYSPKNADKQYYGYVSVRDAVAKSLNIPAVKALDYLSIKQSKEFLTRLGINISNSDLNLSLALGSVKNGVSILDLISAYSTIANMGVQKNTTFVKQILDKNGNTIYENDTFAQQVVDKASCYLMTDILKETVSNGTARRLNELNIPIASKTGTANNGKYDTDLYNIAYTTNHTICTWISNIKDHKLPEGMKSSCQPTEINKLIFKELYKNIEPKDFEMPDTVEKMPYDLTELELNHRIVAPTQNLERYIEYDYFKKDNPPEIITIKNEIYPNIALEKTGVSISFTAKKNCIYKIYRKIKGKTYLLEEIKNTNGLINFKDSDIFKYSEITYSILDDNNVSLCESFSIRPKDYLVNMLNNEIVTNKKKWYV